MHTFNKNMCQVYKGEIEEKLPSCYCINLIDGIIAKPTNGVNTYFEIKQQNRLGMCKYFTYLLFSFNNQFVCQ